MAAPEERRGTKRDAEPLDEAAAQAERDDKLRALFEQELEAWSVPRRGCGPPPACCCRSC